MMIELSEELEQTVESLNRYTNGDWDVSYTISMEYDVTGAAYDNLVKDYKMLDTKVSGAKTVEVELHINSSGNSDTRNMEISLIKVGRNWYLDMLTMGSLF